MANNFEIRDNVTRATLTVSATDDAGVPAVATEVTAVSSNPSVLTVEPAPGFPGSFFVRTQNVLGSVDVTLVGTNVDGNTFTDVFHFNITVGPAKHFTGVISDVTTS